MAHHPPWGGVGGGCHPDGVHGAPSWVVGLQHPCNNPLAVVCVLPQVPHQMAGSAKSVSALQHAGAAAGPAAQQAGPRPPPEPPPRRREHRIAPPTQGLPRRRPGGTRRQPKHYGTSTEGQARTRAAGRGALYGGGHVPTGRSGRAPRPKNLPPRSCAGMKGLALEPGLDSSPWGDEGDSGSSAGARTTSFFQHIPSSCTTSAGKRRGTRRSSIEPPEGAPTASCNATTFPPPFPNAPVRFPALLPAPPPPRHWQKRCPKHGVGGRGTLEHHGWFLPRSPLCPYFNRVTFAFAISAWKIGSRRGDAGVRAAVGCLLGTRCSSERANRGGEAGVAPGRWQGGSCVGSPKLRLPPLALPLPFLGAMGYLSGAVSPSDGRDPGANHQR